MTEPAAAFSIRSSRHRMILTKAVTAGKLRVRNICAETALRLVNSAVALTLTYQNNALSNLPAMVKRPIPIAGG